jgi:hypothetical protein
MVSFKKWWNGILHTKTKAADGAWIVEPHVRSVYYKNKIKSFLIKLFKFIISLPGVLLIVFFVALPMVGVTAALQWALIALAIYACAQIILAALMILCVILAVKGAQATT